MPVDARWVALLAAAGVPEGTDTTLTDGPAARIVASQAGPLVHRPESTDAYRRPGHSAWSVRLRPSSGGQRVGIPLQIGADWGLVSGEWARILLATPPPPPEQLERERVGMLTQATVQIAADVLAARQAVALMRPQDADVPGAAEVARTLGRVASGVVRGVASVAGAGVAGVIAGLGPVPVLIVAGVGVLLAVGAGARLISAIRR